MKSSNKTTLLDILTAIGIRWEELLPMLLVKLPFVGEVIR